MRLNASALYSSLLADLSKEIDTQLPSWAPDSTEREVACYALRDSLVKKFNEADRPSESASVAALEKFEAVNERCGSWVIPYEFSLDEQIVGEVKSALYDFWFTPDGPIVTSFNQLFLYGRAGPGASILARGEDFYTKMFDGPLSGTGDLPFVWERLMSLNATWSDAHASSARRWPSTVVESSNYSFVNKTTTIARGICTEPSINMFFQLGFGEVLNRRLKGVYGYDPALQPDVNRVMARRGSLDGSFVTIDLESASDSLGLKVLEEILPRDFCRWLKILRSPKTRLENRGVVDLNMVSTMGNGFTFPLQTLVFMSVVKAAYKLLGIPLLGTSPVSEFCDPYSVGRTFSVFGDDIIVDTRAATLVLRGLYLLGLVVNQSKTFVKGPFRESCGADYFNGVNVRGVYIKSLRTQQDVCVAINTLIRWSAKTGVSLPETTSYLLTGVTNPLMRLVPPDEDDAAGIHVPYELLDPTYYPTVCKSYWYQGKRVSTHVTLVPYYAYVPDEFGYVVADGHIEVTKGMKRRNYNCSGLLIAFLMGGIRGRTVRSRQSKTVQYKGHVTLRQRHVTYTSKLRHTPCWGRLLPRPLEYPLGCSEDRRFVHACKQALSGLIFGWGV